MNAESWYQYGAIKTLGLDFARPVYAELGALALGPEETVRGLARDAVTGRLGSELGEAHWPQGGAISWSIQPGSIHSMAVESFLLGVGRAFGNERRDAARYWTTYVAIREKWNPWVFYQDAMSHWAMQFRMTGVDEIGLSLDPALVEGRYRQSSDVSAPEAALLERRHRPLTEWDYPLFCEVGLLETPEGSEYFPFVDGLYLIIRMHNSFTRSRPH